MKKILLSFIALSLVAGTAFAQSPNERVHVLHKRDYSVKNKIELSGFFGMSIDDIFTQHYSGILTFDYHIDEAFALEVMWLSCKIPGYHGSAVEGGYTDDWLRMGHNYTDAFNNLKESALSPSNADLAMISNYWGLNVQFSPIYGKFSLFNWGLVHADFYITAGGGVATTEYKKPTGTTAGKAIWADTGTYFMANFGFGFRVFLSRWFAIRLDVRDFTFSARVEADSGASTTAGTDTKIRNTMFVMLGISFLFGGEEPVEIWSPY